LHRGKTTTSKVAKATAKEIIHASTEASESPKSSAESTAEASTKSSESVINELIRLLLLSSDLALMTVALLCLVTKATKSTSHESIIVVKEVGERIPSAEEVSEDLLGMLERVMIVEAAAPEERPSSGSGPTGHPQSV
jgi:Cdc6-like AAA superfamily ATPase